MDLFYINVKERDGKSAGKKLHNAGRYIIQYAAKNFYNIENPEIEIVNNKPKYKYSDINFSISHSKDIAAVCFDTEPVGFDIQDMRNCDYITIATRMNFKLKENTKEEFYRLWTLYEAGYKLQDEVKSSYTQFFENNYIMSVVSAVNKEIILDIKSIPVL